MMYFTGRRRKKTQWRTDEEKAQDAVLFKEGKKICRRCNQTLPTTEFYIQKATIDGLKHYCKACFNSEYYDKEKSRVKSLSWRKANPDKVRAASRKEKSKPHNRIKNSMKRRINDYLRATNSKDTWRSVTSCTPKELVAHLESQFTPAMSWTNYGSYWHIDHIIPCAAFDPSRPNQLKWCWHYKNLRPLEGKENVDKRDILSTGEYASDLKRDNPARLREIVTAELARLGIAITEEVAASYESAETIRYIEV